MWAELASQPMATSWLRTKARNASGHTRGWYKSPANVRKLSHFLPSAPVSKRKANLARTRKLALFLCSWQETFPGKKPCRMSKRIKFTCL